MRIVPGGSAVRDGAYIAPRRDLHAADVHQHRRVGRRADRSIDSHALVGSCAQVGARVHVSAGAQIGGVIEPVGALPVIIEDDVLVGGNTGVYEGAIVKSARRARRRHGPHRIDAGLRPGATGEIIKPAAGPAAGRSRRRRRRAGRACGDGRQRPEWGLSLATPVIVKYRDSRTDTRTELEAWIR